MNLDRLRKMKKNLGYSNVELAHLTEIPVGTLNKILSGATKNPRPENLEALERVLFDTTYQYGYVSAAPFLLQEEAAAYGVKPEEPHEKRPGEFTIDDYYALPDDKRVELINGRFFEMEAPSVEHQAITGSVYAQLLDYVRRKKKKCMPLISPVDVKLDADNKTMVQPDVIVVCNRKQITEARIEGGPSFVMEVVSPGSVTKDYIKKNAKYNEAGVREYWIVDPVKKKVIAYDFSTDGYPAVYPLGGKIGVAIFNNELEIDFDEYKDMLEGDEEEA